VFFKTWWVFVLIVSLGFFQERFKVALNFYLEVAQTTPGFFDLNDQQKDAQIEGGRLRIPYDYYHNHKSFKLFHSLRLSQLKAFKWAATAVFIFLNGYLGWLVLRCLKWKDAKPFYLWLHVSVLILALLLFISGQLIHFEKEGYAAARKLVGFLQSPTPAIIVAFCYFGMKHFNPNDVNLDHELKNE